MDGLGASGGAALAKAGYRKLASFTASGTLVEVTGNTASATPLPLLADDIAAGIESSVEAAYDITVKPAIKGVGNTVIANTAKTGVQITKHAAERMVERGITQKMVETGIAKGTKYLDPKNGPFNYVLKNGFASRKDLLIGISPQTGKVTTVLRGNNLVNKRFIPQYKYGNFRKNIN